MPEASGLMRGKRGLIMGVANNRSIAWGIAKAVPGARRGARLHLSGRRAEEAGRAARRRRSAGSSSAIATSPTARPSTRSSPRWQRQWGALDFVVHAIAFSDKDQLDGRYVDTTADNFTKTMLISCYSFTAVAQRAEKLMTNGGSLLTLTYYGAEKWMPHYNVMGVAKAALEASVRYLAADLGAKNIRVNAISAGPIKTLAASGIGDFRYILKWNEYNSPLRRTVTIEEVGDTAVYLLSDMSRGVTGEIHHVDAGYHIVGMKHPDAPDIASSRSERGHRRAMPMAQPVLYYVRHGETDWNVEGRLQGQHDIPTQRERGRAQARALRRDPARPARARRARRRPTSTTCRARSGARARPWSSCAQRSASTRPATAPMPRLTEISFGRWEGLTYAELQATAARDVLAARERDKWDFAPPGGESYAAGRGAGARLARDARRATPWWSPMAAPRGRWSRISASRRRRPPRPPMSTRASSTCSRRER